jgi:hypothetical protein
MNSTINDHLRANWSQIVNELVSQGFSEQVNILAGQVVGEGFVEGVQLPNGDWTAIPTDGTSFTVRIRLIDGNPPKIMILTSFAGP